MTYSVILIFKQYHVQVIASFRSRPLFYAYRCVCAYHFILNENFKVNLLVLKIGTEDPSGNIWGSISNGTMLNSGGASLKLFYKYWFGIMKYSPAILTKIF